MKKHVLYISIFILLAVCIKCSIGDMTWPSDNYIGETKTIKVKEYKTNLPVSGAKFTTYYCKEHDFEFGNCINYVQISSCTTNNDGVCNCAFPKDPYGKIDIESNNHWSKNFQTEPNNEYVIQPKAWITLNFATDEEYPATSYFFIRINGEIQNTSDFIPAVNNSSKVVTIFGNEENSVVWELRETFSTNSQLLNSGNFTLNPERFENLTYTLHY